MRRLDELVPKNQSLRPALTVVNDALKNTGPLLTFRYAAETERERLSFVWCNQVMQTLNLSSRLPVCGGGGNDQLSATPVALTQMRYWPTACSETFRRWLRVFA